MTFTPLVATQHPTSLKPALFHRFAPKLPKSLARVPPAAALQGRLWFSATTLPAGRYAIVSRRSGKALEINGEGQIVQNQLNSSAPQLWDISLVAGGYYAIKSVKTGLTLTLADWQTGKVLASANLAGLMRCASTGI